MCGLFLTISLRVIDTHVQTENIEQNKIARVRYVFGVVSMFSSCLSVRLSVRLCLFVSVCVYEST